MGGADGIDVRRWLGARLAADGFDPERLDAAPPYAMPESAIAQGGRYGGELAEAGQGPLADWFAFAERQLDGARAAFAALSLEAPAPRLWPHHFDLATLVAFAAARGETGYVGAGFSPGDGYYDEPYFYVSIYPKRDLATLPALSSPGVWHSKDFLAAVAPAHRVLASKDVPKDVAAYLREAIKAAVAALRL